jgi:predicted amidophosphoribosyltransferase
VRAAVEYDRVARRLVLRAKFCGRIEILRHLGEQLAHVVSLSRIAESCSLVTAVPSHPWVGLRRGFNPALEIARPVARTLGIPLRRGVLSRRLKAMVPAKRLTAVERRTALRNAFRARRLLLGERVLLVDDLLTTGATADSCAATLLLAGAESVRLAVWARTPLRR